VLEAMRLPDPLALLSVEMGKLFDLSFVMTKIWEAVTRTVCSPTQDLLALEAI
jgi:hypothetical protein